MTLERRKHRLCLRMNMEQAHVIEHEAYAGGYRLLVVGAPEIAASVRPGQFVHLRVPNLEAAVLRRPFSVFAAEAGRLSLLYKAVGKGTRAMAALRPDAVVNLIGPLGNGFQKPDPERTPVVVAGGYGGAPLLFLARVLGGQGTAFIGGATAEDILCVKDFEELFWPVHSTTEDGSLGSKGLVTAALDEWIDARTSSSPEPEIFACGPEGMLKAVGTRAIAHGWQAWLSLDRRMGCGVGACLVCVQRIQQADGTVTWARACRDGPVFEAREVVWD